MNLRSHNDPTPVLLTQGGAGYPRDSCEELSPGTLPAKSGMDAEQEIQVQSLDQEDPLEKEVATHSRILACEIS